MSAGVTLFGLNLEAPGWEVLYDAGAKWGDVYNAGITVSDLDYPDVIREKINALLPATIDYGKEGE